MKVVFNRKFTKDIDKLPNSAIKIRLAELIEFCEMAETTDNLPNLKKLVGFNNFFRLRMGDYRIGILLDEDCIHFIRILHRKEIYKAFP
jgi:mRNA interferase RelE/StbE